MIRVKGDHVKLANMSAGLMFGIYVADQVIARKGYECVLTSGNDSRHGPTSLHYANQAVDIRTRDMPEIIHENVAREIKERLGMDYDVILEADHIHLECQPKRRGA